MKIQKIYTYIICSMLAFFTSSCTDWLDVPSNSYLSDDYVFSTPDSANQGIAAIYNMVGENNSYRNRLWLQLGLNTDIEYRSGWSSGAPLSISKADDYFALYSAIPSIAEGYNNADAANPWSRLYQAIERCNLAVAGIRKYGNPAVGNDMGQLLGEALAMRAYFYYDLVKWWGDVPARFEPVNESNIYMGKSNRDSIYNKIIFDLQEASNLLYEPGASKYTQNTKRVSRDAAKGFLARVCLSAAGYSMRPISGSSDSEIKITVSEERRKELYTIAREACREVIAAGHYSLDASFKSIFYLQCQDVTSHGHETMWQLPYFMGTRGRMVYNLGLPRDADNVNNKVTVGGQFKVVPSFFYDYNVNDTRRDVTVVPYKVSKNSDGLMEQSVSSGVIGYNIAKWRAEWVKNPITGTDDGVSPIIIRYADVLLMFAEADLYLGGSEGAEYYNMVRRRAFGQSTNAVSPYDLPLTLENLKKERAFEFCGENIRKYDLERWGELKAGLDKAKQNLLDLRDSKGSYADVPQTIYYKWTSATTPTAGERILTIYGLNRGETDNKTVTDPNGGWTKKTWTQGTTSYTVTNNGVTSTVSEFYLSDGYVKALYVGDPDKRQLLPIMNQIITTSNGLLYNDYGY